MSSESPVIERHAVEPLLKNGYVLGCPKTQQAAYIDPGEEASQVLNWVQENGFQLIAIINTHAHMDHICGIQAVRQEWEVPIFLHSQDESLYNALPEQAQWFGLNYPPAPAIDHFLSDGQELKVGQLRLKVHHTPGHSPGGVCLEVGEHVFCDDLIFSGSIGRTDLPGGSYETIMKSIRETILPLGDDKILHPGHGPDTSIGRERQTNPFLTGSPPL